MVPLWELAEDEKRGKQIEEAFYDAADKQKCKIETTIYGSVSPGTYRINLLGKGNFIAANCLDSYPVRYKDLDYYLFANAIYLIQSESQGLTSDFMIAPCGDGTYHIKVDTDRHILALDLSGEGKAEGTPLIVAPLNPESKSQKWRIRSVDTGVYIIQNEASGLVVDLPDYNFSYPCVQLPIWHYHGGPGQKYTLSKISDFA